MRADEAGRAFNRMIERIRTRYSIHYKQPESGNTGFRKIEVELTPSAKLRYPRAQVNARKGYRVGGSKSRPRAGHNSGACRRRR